MKVSAPLTRSLAVAALLPFALPARAVDLAPRKLDGLSKEQIQALPDTQPVQIGGKTLTRTQLKIELEKGRAQVRADLQNQVRQKLQAFEQMKTRSAQTQTEKARSMKASALAEAGRFASAMPTPTPKAAPAPPAGPAIKTVGAAFLVPGGTFMVAGESLGSSDGTAKLEWKFAGSVKLFVEHWKNNLAVLTMPDVSGLQEQTARLVLTRTDGKSASAEVVFKPDMDWKLLPSHDTIVVCSDLADINNCDKLPDQTFEGTHANTFDISNDHGQDKFKVSLKNGWVVDSWDFLGRGWSIIGQDPRFHLSGISAGASALDILVDFSVPPGTDSSYYGLVYIRGPKGTSYK